MSSDLRAAIQRAATVTFNAFSRKSLREGLPRTSKGDPVSVAIEFTGPRKGRLEVNIWEDALGDLAASMFDQTVPPPFDDQLDAIREVTNVIAGNVVSSLDSTNLFNLGLPKVQQVGTSAGVDPSAVADFALGSGRVTVRLFMEN
jgi:CheY-specific phosphatase CheX